MLRWKKLKKPAWQIFCVHMLGMGKEASRRLVKPNTKGSLSAFRWRQWKAHAGHLLFSIPHLYSCPDRAALAAQPALARAGHLGYLQIEPETGQRSMTTLHTVLIWEAGPLGWVFMRL